MDKRLALDVKTFRIIPSQYPPIRIFEDCVDTDYLEALYELESLTNSRLRAEAGILERVSREDWISGPGTSPIMASFTHCGMPSRFTDGTYGVYYAGLDLNTAIAETKYWQEIQLADSSEPPMDRVMRVYTSYTDPETGSFVDLRKDLRVQHLTDYSTSQQVAKTLRDNAEYGIYYSSVRRTDGECIAAFRPPIMKPASQSMHLRYCWNGESINHIEKVTSVDI